MYTAVSVCTAKLTKLTSRNAAAYVYRVLVSLLGSFMGGSRSLNLVDLLEPMPGRGGDSYSGGLSPPDRSGCDWCDDGLWNDDGRSDRKSEGMSAGSSQAEISPSSPQSSKSLSSSALLL